MAAANQTIIRLAETLRRTGLSRSTLYDLQTAGEFPKSIKLTRHRHGSAVGWLESEVNAWIEARIAERDQLAQHAWESTGSAVA
jgi:prophage regulatory protein